MTARHLPPSNTQRRAAAAAELDELAATITTSAGAAYLAGYRDGAADAHRDAWTRLLDDVRTADPIAGEQCGTRGPAVDITAAYAGAGPQPPWPLSCELHAGHRGPHRASGWTFGRLYAYTRSSS